MTKLQFRILYRQFLFRMVDLELLSAYAQGDSSKLLGQFGSLLIFTSILLSIPALGYGPRPGHPMTPAQLQQQAYSFEHLLIATTMLVVGIFVVLSWESTFPDRRDVMVLGPLPVRTPTLFLAKVAAAGGSLGLVIVSLQWLAAPFWTLALGQGSFWAMPRFFAAYWGTMLAAGAFLYCLLLAVQGAAAELLPRRLFLRVSGMLQIAAFCGLLCWYFLQPVFAGPAALRQAQGNGALAWSPSYWFLGLLQQLNGSGDLSVLARRGWMGLAMAVCGAGVAYTLSYLRTLRRIVEEPDITPGFRRTGWLPRFGSALTTAIVHFSARTLLRSRQHRMILAFYLGVGFALTIFLLRVPVARDEVNAPAVGATLVMIAAWVMGTRVAFSMPIDLRANWIFRVLPVRSGTECVAGRRRALLLLAVMPVCTGTAAMLFAMWPWRAAAAYIAILVLTGFTLAEMALYGALKIPFTCSYLPGKSNVHLTFWFCLGILIQILGRAAVLATRAVKNPRTYMAVVCSLIVAAAIARRRNSAADEALQFEAEDPGAVQVLGLSR